jgi:adenylate cyclase class 2
MLEIEMKFPVDGLEQLEERVRCDLAAESVRRAREIDHYFQAPDRNFAETGEALRVRRVGFAAFMTYKGPRLDTLAKTRPEIEVALREEEGQADRLLNLLARLGYRPIAVVDKTRHTFRLECNGFGVNICLDRVEELGSFAEIEVLAEESQFDKAQQAVMEVARQLGLTRMERRSYLKLLLRAREKSR